LIEWLLHILRLESGFFDQLAVKRDSYTEVVLWLQDLGLHMSSREEDRGPH
jgi:hypothetical protein